MGLTRIHMEEDAGKSLHEGFPIPIAARTSTTTAVAFRSSRSSVNPTCDRRPKPPSSSPAPSILVWLGVSDGNMEEGSLRCDANVSIRPRGQTKLGTKAEVKNVNSFRYLERPSSTRSRQIDLIEGGGGWSRRRGSGIRAPVARTRCAARKKPTTIVTSRPDLPLLVDEARSSVRSTMPELPDAQPSLRRSAASRRRRGRADAVSGARRLLRGHRQGGEEAKAASNWIMGELLRMLSEARPEISDVPISSLLRSLV